MLLQNSLNLQNPNISLSVSSSLCYSPPLPSKFTFPQVQSLCFQRLSIVTCSSISNIHTQRKPVASWKVLCKKISFMQNPDLGSATVLNQWEDEGNNLTKWELCRVVKELRKHKKHDRALEVYGWMNDREERFVTSESDAAIQVDLISKVRGVSSAEEYFLRLAGKLKDRRTHCALLNVYVRSRLKEKAEFLFDIMRRKGYATNSLPYNVMMTLYMNLKKYEKVGILVSEMMENNIKLDTYSYNIWLSSCGYQGSIEKMEQVFERMTKESTIVPNWTIFSTMATVYIKMDLFEKAEECIRTLESSIKVRDRLPFHYLLTLYGNVGKKEEVYRVWNMYKLIFSTRPNSGYHSIVYSLVRTGDIEGAENLYQEWLSVQSSFDPKIGNLLIGWYVRNGCTDKALGFFEQMIESGGIPCSSTWEILSAVHIAEKRIPEALSCLKEAFVADVSKTWRPNPMNLSAFLELCDSQEDMESAKILVGLLTQSEFLKDGVYASLIGLSNGTSFGKDELSINVGGADRVDDIYDNERRDVTSNMVFNQMESSL